MSDASASRQPAVTVAAGADRGAELRARLCLLAESTRTSLSAALCIIGWQTTDAAGELHTPGNASRSDAEAQAVLRALGAESGAHAGAFAESVADDGVREIILTRPELAAILSRAALADDRTGIWAGSFGDGDTTVRAVLVAPIDRRGSEVKASLQVLGRAALAAVSASAAAASRAFWRNRATEALAGLAQGNSGTATAERTRNEVEVAVRALARASSRGRFAQLGSVVASACGFDGWIVAAVRDGALAVVASSPSAAPLKNLASAGAIAESFRSGLVIQCDPAAGRTRAFAEDRVFGRPWVVVPFEQGAIALASHRAVAPEARAKAEAVAAHRPNRPGVDHRGRAVALPRTGAASGAQDVPRDR